MSLVNDMLKDLDRRQAPEQQSAPQVAGYGNLTQDKTNRSWLIAILMGVALLLAVVIAVTWHFKDELLAFMGNAPEAPSEIPVDAGAIDRPLAIGENNESSSDKLSQKEKVDPSGQSEESLSTSVPTEHAVAQNPDSSVAVQKEQDVSPVSNSAEKNVSLVDDGDKPLEDSNPRLADSDKPFEDLDKPLEDVGRLANSPSNAEPKQSHLKTENDVEKKPVQDGESGNLVSQPIVSNATHTEPEPPKPLLKKRVVKTPAQIDAELVSSVTRMLQSDPSPMNIAKAELLLDKHIQIADFHDGSSEMLVLLLLQQGKVEQATEVIAQHPVSNRYLDLKLKARTFQHRGDIDSAVKILEGQLPELKQDPDYHVMLAALYQQQGRFNEAVSLYANLVTVDDTVGNWWAGLGISLEGAAQIDAAVRAYRKALSQNNVNTHLANYIDARLVALTK